MTIDRDKLAKALYFADYPDDSLNREFLHIDQGWQLYWTSYRAQASAVLTQMEKLT